MSKIIYLENLYNQSIKRLTSNENEWKDLLSTVGRFYKRSFDNAVLIHVQAPDSTQLATFDEWHSEGINRSINKGVKGLAVIDMSNPQASIKHYFDLMDTNGSALSFRRVVSYMWELEEQYKPSLMVKLHEKYGTNTESLEDCLYEIIEQRVLQNLSNYVDNYEIKDESSVLYDAPKDVVRQEFLELIARSVYYTVMSRCGLKADDVSFENIGHFDTLPLFISLGSCITNIARQTLKEIDQEIKVIKSERSKIYEQRTQNTQRTVDTSNLHRGSRRSALSEPRNIRERTDRGSGQIREDVERVDDRQSSRKSVGTRGDRTNQPSDSQSGRTDRGTQRAVDTEPTEITADTTNGGYTGARVPHEDDLPHSRGTDNQRGTIQSTIENDEEKPSVESHKKLTTDGFFVVPKSSKVMEQQVVYLEEKEDFKSVSMFPVGSFVDYENVVYMYIGTDEKNSDRHILRSLEEQNSAISYTTQELLEFMLNGKIEEITEPALSAVFGFHTNDKVSIWNTKYKIIDFDYDEVIFENLTNENDIRKETLVDALTYLDMSNKQNSQEVTSDMTYLGTVVTINENDYVITEIDPNDNPPLAYLSPMDGASKGIVEKLAYIKTLLEEQLNPATDVTRDTRFDLDDKEFLEIADEFILASDIEDNTLDYQAEICDFFNEPQHNMQSKKDAVKVFYGSLNTSYVTEGGDYIEEIKSDSEGISLSRNGQRLYVPYQYMADRIEHFILMGEYPFSKNADLQIDDYAIPDEIDEMNGAEYIDEEIVSQAVIPQGNKAWQEILQAKQEYSNDIIFYQVGHFFEVYDKDAVLFSELFGFAVLGKDMGLAERVSMCGIPKTTLNQQIERLHDLGYDVSTLEQNGNRHELVRSKREVAEVIDDEDETERYIVEQTSDAWELPFIVRDTTMSDDDPNRYYHSHGYYHTYETEEEAQEDCDRLNGKIPPLILEDELADEQDVIAPNLFDNLGRNEQLKLFALDMSEPYEDSDTEANDGIITGKEQAVHYPFPIGTRLRYANSIYEILQYYHDAKTVEIGDVSQLETIGSFKITERRTVAGLENFEIIKPDNETLQVNIKSFFEDSWVYKATFEFESDEYTSVVTEQGGKHYVRIGSKRNDDLQRLYLTEEQVVAFEEFVKSQQLDTSLFPVGTNVYHNEKVYEILNYDLETNTVELGDIEQLKNLESFKIRERKPLSFLEQCRPMKSHYTDGELAEMVVNATQNRDSSDETQDLIYGASIINNANNEYDRARAFDFIDRSHSDTLNYKYSPDHNLYEGGPKAKCRANIEAIRLLKNLESEQRMATSDEQKVLAKYVGWGGLANALTPNKDGWLNEYAEIASLLTEEELLSAQESTITAYYTEQMIIDNIYKALDRFGFKSGNILDPAMGTGNFFSVLQGSMAQSNLYGVELDSITGGIAKQLYPDAEIQVKGFEHTNFSDQFFDVAIGNIPFNNISISDKKYNKYNFKIHDYFIAKSLDKVRPGGIVAFITSKGTMDKANPNVRKYIAQRAELMGAIRLPNNAFKQVAGTEVTSDILFFQKRETEIVPSQENSPWLTIEENEDGIPVNSYFIEHPEMILGQMVFDRSMYGDEKATACHPIDGDDLADRLDSAVHYLDGEYKEPTSEFEEEKENTQVSIDADSTVKNFSYTIHDGKVWYRENSRMYLQEIGGKKEERIRGQIYIHKALRDLIDYQTDDYVREHADSEVYKENIEKKIAYLNHCYDEFVSKHGYLNLPVNISAFKRDSGAPLLRSAEKAHPDNDKVFEKADMFYRPTIQRREAPKIADNAHDALKICLNERGKVDLLHIHERYENANGERVPPAEIIKELGDLIYQDPDLIGKNGDIGGFVLREEYLSGYVKDKLKKAQEMAEDYPDRFSRNVEALQEVQPEPLLSHEIEFTLGSTWIPREIYQQFIYEICQTDRNDQTERGVSLEYSEYANRWHITSKSYGNSSVITNQTHGTARKNAYEIIEDSLNLQKVEVRDRVDYIDPQTGVVLCQEKVQVKRGKISFCI